MQMTHKTCADFYKKYYLTGRHVKIKWKDSPDSSVWGNQWMPAIVLAEYPKWLLVEIQPHYNTSGFAQGKSHPYRIGVSKAALAFGEFEMRMN